MAHVINADECINCGVCEDECPVSCISEADGARTIAADDCVDCGACVNVCPVDCISAE